jgi:glutamate/aspartate transport system permease protein
MGRLDFSVIADTWPFLLNGLIFSLELTAVGFLGGLLLGTGLALVRHLDVPVAAPLAGGYITLMRSIPLIMVLFWFFFLMPLILMWAMDSSRPVQIGPVWTAFITFTLFEAAYYAEIIRSGLRAIPKGQYEACKALAMSTADTYRLVILPQVLRIVSPILPGHLACLCALHHRPARRSIEDRPARRAPGRDVPERCLGVHGDLLAGVPTGCDTEEAICSPCKSVSARP